VPGAARGRPSAVFSARISLPLSSFPSLSPLLLFFFSHLFFFFSSFPSFSPLLSSFPTRAPAPSRSPLPTARARASPSSPCRAPAACPARTHLACAHAHAAGPHAHRLGITWPRAHAAPRPPLALRPGPAHATTAARATHTDAAHAHAPAAHAAVFAHTPLLPAPSRAHVRTTRRSSLPLCSPAPTHAHDPPCRSTRTQSACRERRRAARRCAMRHDASPTALPAE